MEKVIGITRGKYMDTEIDTILIHFSDTKKASYVSEYDVPPKFPYMVFMSTKPDKRFPSWIEIVNPKAILTIDNPPLPDLGDIEYQGEQYTIENLIKKLIG